MKQPDVMEKERDVIDVKRLKGEIVKELKSDREFWRGVLYPVAEELILKRGVKLMELYGVGGDHYERIEALREELNKKHIELLERIVRVETELKNQRELIKAFMESVDKRFEAVDKRFEELIHYIDKRFEAVDKRFDSMNKRIGTLEKLMFAFNVPMLLGIMLLLWKVFIMP